ncbi:MAG: DegT/DnrJ/EryC1/StrS family aminotransferase [candidate division WS1 bacterium]|jgi:dTDP-4-amino-4,6-dideoxygalactose transaminase|nr:DegT/DnrJ/EryC1/StrS family aminotransferase [candidate division WS1 bacterium]
MDADRRQEIIATQKPEIPWANEPSMGSYYTEAEFEAVRAEMERCNHPQIGFNAHNDTSREFEEKFAAWCGAPHALTVNGAGSGLDLAVMALQLEPGDEVIVPAVNFKAAALSVLGQGGKVVWCEVDERTFQADPADVEARLTDRTRAIYPVHMNGMAAPIDEYLRIAEEHPHPKHGPLKVIGDAARSCGARLHDRRVGSWEWTCVFSFHTMKNMTTLGEGGMVVTQDAEAAVMMRKIRGFGGDVWGTNYKMTNVQAAVGLVQLERIDSILDERRKVGHERNELLAGIPEIELPYVPGECWHTYYLYTCLVPEEWAGEKRDRILQLMREDYGVPCVVANPPCYQSHPFLAANTDYSDLPRSEKLGQRLFCVPIHPLMSTSDNEYICASLWETVERVMGE